MSEVFKKSVPGHVLKISPVLSLMHSPYMSGGMMSYLAATFTTGSLLNNHLVLSVRHGISIVETSHSYA